MKYAVKKSGPSDIQGGKPQFLAAILALRLGVTMFAATAEPPVTTDIRSALDQISAESLRGHLSFLASDLLEGRCTPARGGDIAAEYIAAQFRRAGLQPVGDDGYFQTANWRLYEQPMEGFELQVERGEQTFSIGKDRVVLQAYAGLSLSHAPVVKLDLGEKLRAGELRGKAVVVVISDDQSESARQYRSLVSLAADIGAAKPAVLVLLVPSERASGSWSIRSRLEDPDEPQLFPTPIIIAHPDVYALVAEMKPGGTDLRVSLHLPTPSVNQVKLRNVIGLLPGSDAVLRDTYVLISAHYDHHGVWFDGNGRTVYLGANDDGSGTAALVELASVLSRLKDRPKRSIVFLSFFGEEKVLLGSRYYVRHPVFPIRNTVADINLEHLGRTDSADGEQLGRLSFTGFDYSDVTAAFVSAGKQTGVHVYQHDPDSDQWFRRSDNETLADMGVPSVTAHVTFGFSDYHEVGDVWQKIDYSNMAKVSRTLALGIVMTANRQEAPRWNAGNPKAERYFKAWKERPVALPDRHPWPWYLTGCR